MEHGVGKLTRVIELFIIFLIVKYGHFMRN